MLGKNNKAIPGLECLLSEQARTLGICVWSIAEGTAIASCISLPQLLRVHQNNRSWTNKISVKGLCVVSWLVLLPAFYLPVRRYSIYLMF